MTNSIENIIAQDNILSQISSVLNDTTYRTSTSKQIALENVLNELGSMKFLATVDANGEASSPYLSKILQEMITEVDLNILEAFKESKQARGTKNTLHKVLTTTKEERYKNSKKEWKHRTVNRVSSTQVSLIVVFNVLNQLRTERLKRTNVAVKIGQAILKEANLYQEDTMTGYDDLDERATIEYRETRTSVAVKLGIQMLSILSSTFPHLFSVELKGSKGAKHAEYFLIPTEEYLTLVEGIISDLAEYNTIIMPMVAKPKLWESNGLGGGFYTPAFQRPIIKGFLGSEMEINDLNLRVINAVSQVGYSINTDMLETLKVLVEKQPKEFTKLFPTVASSFTEEAPFKGTPWESLDKKQRAEMMAYNTRKEVHRQQRDRKISADYLNKTILTQATLLKNEETIYFPHDLDYRNRQYSIAMNGLNLQGSDVAKCCIQYDKGEKITTIAGMESMKKNLANHLGMDKAEPEEKIQWVDENTPMIRSIVENRLTDLSWAEWDKPMQGMASAIEFVKWLDDKDYEHKTWSQLDGNCNGSQHLAAMTRDYTTGVQVGLVPTDKRPDIYTAVLDVLKKNLALVKDEAFVSQWTSSGLLARPLTKTPTMTLSYGCTSWGVRNGTQALIMEKAKHGYFDDVNGTANKMGDMIFKSMNEVVGSPLKMMEWLQKCARVLASHNLPLTWTNAAGMTCSHAPYKQKVKRVQTTSGSESIRVQLMVKTDKINPDELAAASSPNITHSNDSSHLVITSDHMMSFGIKRFSFVHDSFGTTHENAARLEECAKNAWIEMYQDINWPEKLEAEFNSSLFMVGIDAKVPSYIEYFELGTLEANQVVESTAFFS